MVLGGFYGKIQRFFENVLEKIFFGSQTHGLIRCFQIVAPYVGQTKIFLVGNSLLITIL